MAGINNIDDIDVQIRCEEELIIMSQIDEEENVESYHKAILNSLYELKELRKIRK